MKSRLSLILALVLGASLFTAACRSKVKPQVAPPQQAAVEPPAPAPVRPTQTDFVVEQKDDPILSADLDELNRIARERGWIHDAFFAFDSSMLDSRAQSALQSSALWLRENRNFKLVLEGHCDERGTQQYNLALGDRRANAAREYLVALGIEPSRIETVSFGEERPFALGSSETAWSQNRRAHLVLRR